VVVGWGGGGGGGGGAQCTEHLVICSTLAGTSHPANLLRIGRTLQWRQVQQRRSPRRSNGVHKLVCRQRRWRQGNVPCVRRVPHLF